MKLSRGRLLSSTAAVYAAAGFAAGARTIVAAQSPVAVRVGSGNVEPVAQVFYALDQGFFRRNGIDAQLTILRSGGVVMEAIVSGGLDAGGGNCVTLGSAILRKVPFVIVAPGSLWDARYPNAAIVVAAGATFTSAKDFNGQTLGVTSLGSVDGLGFEAFMDANGGDLGSVKFVEVVPSAMAETVASGRIAAGIINDPELSSAVAAGKVKRFVSAYDGIGKLFYGTAWFTTADWLGKNKETAKRFAAAIEAGGEWAESHRQASLAILEKYTKFHEDKSIARYGRKLDPTQLQPVWDAAYKYKLYPTPLKAVDYCWDGK